MRVNKFSGTSHNSFRYPQYAGHARQMQFQQFYQEGHVFFEKQSKKDVKLLKKYAPTLGVFLVAFALVWTIISLFSSKVVLKDLTNYSAKNETSSYSISYPAKLKSNSKDIVDNTAVFVDKIDSPHIMLRFSSTYVGEKAGTRVDEVMNALKDNTSVLYRTFVDGVSLGNNVTSVRVGSFESYSNLTSSKGVKAPIAATTKDGAQLVGELVVIFGTRSQYSFVMSATKDIWNSNQTIWNSMKDSIKVE